MKNTREENLQTSPLLEKALKQKRIEEYRRALKDYSSPDYVVEMRLDYLENLCRSIIKGEIKKYATKSHAKK